MAGFSLPELILVLIVLGIVAALAVPRFADRQGLRLAAAAGELAATLRLAQRLAIVKNREVCVQVAGNVLAVRLSPGAPAPACSADLTGADGQPLRFAPAVALSASPAGFRYGADGRVLLAPVTFTLGSGGDVRTLRLLPTGALL